MILFAVSKKPGQTAAGGLAALAAGQGHLQAGSTSKNDRTIAKRTSTLSIERGGRLKTTSTTKMATVSFQTVKDLVQIYHGLGEKQTSKKIRSQSASSHCGIGREESVASQPGLDRVKKSHLIGCAEDGES